MIAAASRDARLIGTGTYSGDVIATVDRAAGLLRVDAWGSLPGTIYALHVITLAITAFFVAFAAPLAGVLLSVFICQGAAIVGTLQVVSPWLRLRGTLRVHRTAGSSSWRVERVRGARDLVPREGLQLPKRLILVIDRVDDKRVERLKGGRQFTRHNVWYRAYAVPISDDPDPTDVWGRLFRESGLSDATGPLDDCIDAIDRLAQLADAVWTPMERPGDAPLPAGAISLGRYANSDVAAVVLHGIAGLLEAPVIDTSRPPRALATRLARRPRPIGLEGVGHVSLASAAKAAPLGAVSLAGNVEGAGLAASGAGSSGADAPRRRPGLLSAWSPRESPVTSTVHGPAPVISGIRRELAVGSEVLHLGRSLVRTIAWSMVALPLTWFVLIFTGISVWGPRSIATEVVGLIPVVAASVVGWALSRPLRLRLDAEGFTLLRPRRGPVQVAWRGIRAIDVYWGTVYVTTAMGQIDIATRSVSHARWLAAELEAWVAASASPTAAMTDA